MLYNHHRANETKNVPGTTCPTKLPIITTPATPHNLHEKIANLLVFQLLRENVFITFSQKKSTRPLFRTDAVVGCHCFAKVRAIPRINQVKPG